VIAIYNPVLLQQFKVAMDEMQAKGEGVGTWSDDDDLRVLRMSVPDIAQYATRQKPGVACLTREKWFDSAHCTMLQVLACAPRAAVSCDERRRGEEHLLHGLSQRVSWSFQWGQWHDWQRGLLQHATNVGHMTFAALVHSPRSQHQCISQPASNALCMYSTVYQADRLL
jgi:hypothetical protein